MSLVLEQLYSLHRVFNRRDKLFRRVAAKFVDKKLVDDAISELVSEVCDVMPSSISKPVIFQSLFDLVGETPTKQMLFDTLWRLAGNIPALMRSEPVHPWNVQHSTEVVPAQVIEVHTVRHHSKVTQSVLCQFLAGSPSSLQAHQRWSSRKCAYLARRKDDAGNGFMFSRSPGSRSRREAKYPYADPRQLVGMRCLVVVPPELSEDGPNFQEIRFTSSLGSHNRELLKRRARVDEGYDCPQGFNRSHACHVCHVGTEKCSAACHPRTYEVDFCSSCGQQAYFDRKDFTGYCVNCAAELKKKKS